MRGLLVDKNLLGQMARLQNALQSEPWSEFWASLALPIIHFADVGLADDSPDNLVWRECQRLQLVLMTGNRNSRGDDSQGVTIVRENTPSSLPVLTIGDVDAVLNSNSYVEEVAERLLDYLMAIDNIRGTGRLWLP